MNIRSEKSTNHLLYVFAACVSLAVTAVMVIFILSLAAPAQPAAADGATMIEPPRTLSDFTLVSHTGEPRSLSSLRGRKVLLLFGYTHCPDVCPLTLNEFARVRDLLGSEAEETAFVFVSVDGKRDTPQHLHDYLTRRQVSDFVMGMTGDERTLRRIGRDYNLFFQVHDTADNETNYLVDHTASTFLIDEEGRLVTTFAFGTEPEVISNYILD